MNDKWKIQIGSPEILRNRIYEGVKCRVGIFEQMRAEKIDSKLDFCTYKFKRQVFLGINVQKRRMD